MSAVDLLPGTGAPIVPSPSRSPSTGSWPRRIARGVWGMPLQAKVGAGILLCLVLLAVLAPLIAPYGQNQLDFANLLAGPSGKHWFGTDAEGRDVFSRTLYALRLDLGIIVLDSRKQDSDQRLRRFFQELQIDGTPYMQVGRIVECLFLSPSHFSIGLQCADLVTAATVAAERGVGQGRGYLRQLEPRFAVHPASGEIAGVGLKRFPGEMKNEPRRARLF